MPRSTDTSSTKLYYPPTIDNYKNNIANAPTADKTVAPSAPDLAAAPVALAELGLSPVFDAPALELWVPAGVAPELADAGTFFAEAVAVVCPAPFSKLAPSTMLAVLNTTSVPLRIAT